MDTSSQRPNDPEIVAHERTYKAFNVLLRWCMVLLAAVIAMLVVWFVTPAGFLGAMVTAAIIFLGGYFGLVRHELHQPLDVWTIGR